MRGRRCTVAAIGMALVLTAAGCSSSDGDGGAATTAAAGPSTTAGVPTSTLALSPPAREAADRLAGQGGFTAGQAECIIDVLVRRVGEADGLQIVADDAPSQLSQPQQDALEAAFTGCLSADDLGGLVGVAVQGLAADAGATVTEEQAMCAGKALIAEHTLRGLLFDEGLLDEVFSDTAGLQATLGGCMPDAVALAIGANAARTAQDRQAQTSVRDAFTAAKGLAAATNSFRSLTQQALADAAGADLAFVADAGASTGPGTVSWRLVGTTLYLAVRSTSGACWLVRDDLDDAARIAGKIFGKVLPPDTGPVAACTAAAVADDAYTAAW